MRVVLSLVVVAACLFPALASDPGEPLDCEDWVFLEPGLSCDTFAPLNSLDPGPHVANPFLRRGSTAVVDNEGNKYALRVNGPPTNQLDIELMQLELIKVSPGGSTAIVAYVEDREFTGNDGATGRDHARPTDGETANWNKYEGPALASVLSFDPTNGRILVPLRSFCTTTVGLNVCPDGGPSEYGGGWWIAAIEGFTTTFEILQTYEPATNTIGYRVPYMPMGFQHADYYFDTYYGSLANPIDFSKAQPLQCGYPASPPSVGDYLTVADPLPDPPVNTGRYYITAVNYMGERRHGRQNDGGVLSGRDPAVLPECGVSNR